MTHRPFRAAISLALAAAIAAVIGCNATPATKTEVVTPLPFGAPEGSVEGQRQATLSGQAMLGDEPLANASLMVYDAMTDEEAHVVSPGGGNAIAASGGNLTTDAEGRFNVTLAGIAPGQVVRLVASANGNTLVTLVSGDGETLSSGRQVQQATLDPARMFSLHVLLSRETTMIAKLSDASLKLLQTVKPKAAKDVVKEFFSKLEGQMPGMTTMVMGSPLAVARVVVGLDPRTGALNPDAAAALSQAMVSSGNLQLWLDLNRETIEKLLGALKQRSNLDPALVQRLGRLKNVPVPGTTVTVSFDERYLTIVSGEKKVTIDLMDYAQIDAALKSTEFVEAFRQATAVQ